MSGVPLQPVTANMH